MAFAAVGESENRNTSPAGVKSLYSSPILVFYGIFFAYMQYSVFGYLSVSVCVGLRQKTKIGLV
jgi:hypothetical protein